MSKHFTKNHMPRQQTEGSSPFLFQLITSLNRTEDYPERFRLFFQLQLPPSYLLPLPGFSKIKDPNQLKDTLSAIRSFPRFCKMFSESSTVVMQLPCCPGKQGRRLERQSRSETMEYVWVSPLDHYFAKLILSFHVICQTQY